MQEVTLHFFFDASHRYVSFLYGLVSRLNRKCSAHITKTLNTCSLFRAFFTLRFYQYPFKKFLCYSTQLNNKVFSFQKSYNNQQVHGVNEPAFKILFNLNQFSLNRLKMLRLTRSLLEQFETLSMYYLTFLQVMPCRRRLIRLYNS